jgi:hypothetical protein
MQGNETETSKTAQMPEVKNSDGSLENTNFSKSKFVKMKNQVIITHFQYNIQN